jgi:aldehyde:ferredoxin oxidoreductase
MRFAETGFHLEINLSRGSIDKVATDPGDQQLAGGVGSAARIVRDRVPAEVEPFSPANLLIFSAGLLAGTPVPGANRTSISGISPQGNRYAATGFEGFFATELKHAGFEAIIIRGKSPSPVYLFINDGQVELRDAQHLAGKSPLQTAALIQEELKNRNVQVAAIGVAGENRVFNATIDHFNSSACEGLGAVMGDKGLKAIAVRGTGEVNLADPEKCFQGAMAMHKEINNTPRCGDLLLREEDDCAPAPLDSVPGFWTIERQQDWAVEVQSELVYEQWENYSQEMEEVHETVVDRSRLLRGTGCYNCPKDCHQAVYLPGGGTYFLKSYARLAFAMAAHPDVKLNYGVLAAMQENGLEEHEMIRLYAFTSGLYAAGVINGDDLPGFPDDPAERLAYLVEKVARREGFGAILADGPVSAAARIGRGAAEELLLAAEPPAHEDDQARLLDDTLGICPLLSSFRAQFGVQPPYHLENLPQIIAQAAGGELDAGSLAEISVQIREIIAEINAARSARDSEEQAAA